MSDVVIDACCLLNLIAAGNILPRIEKNDTTSECFPHILHIPDVVEGETLYVYQPDEDDTNGLVKCPLDIQAMIDSCVLQNCTLQSGEESDLFIHLAVRLDDGEAACLAVAKNRSWTLATDDRVARKLSTELDVATLSTAELVKTWAEETNANDQEIRVSLTNIQRFARFVPRVDSRESKWWYQHAK